MKYIFTFFLSLFCILPSFAGGSKALTLSRVLMEDIAHKSLPDFTAKYLVTSSALNMQIEKALLSEKNLCLVQGIDNVSQRIAQFSNCITRAVVGQKPLAAVGGYIPSFAKDSKIFAQQTGFEYSDMSVMLRHSLSEPLERNFAGYYVQDFRELQKVAINPATGQTLDEALRAAYQQATEAKGGILIITEETPEKLETFRRPLFAGGPKVEDAEMVPAGLKDMYVMDWANGRWLSYKRSTLDPLWERQQEVFPNGAIIDVKDNRITVAYGTKRTKDDFTVPVTLTWIIKDFLYVPSSSAWYEQLKYAKEKGYYVQVEKLPGATQEAEDSLSNIRFLFARKKGEPVFDNVYELERSF